MFATFYEDLYSEGAATLEQLPYSGVNGLSMQPASDKEVEKQLSKMSQCKACDANGVAAELLEDGDKALCMALAELYNYVEA